jgi:hypothetical protein
VKTPEAPVAGGRFLNADLYVLRCNAHLLADAIEEEPHQLLARRLGAPVIIVISMMV